MAITAADVKKLRDLTGAGMMDAKKALTEADGDFDKATELLRITGATKVANRADREASNGLVAASGKAMIQLAAETDFVAKNEEFMALAERIAEAVAASDADSVETANQLKLADGKTVAEAVAAMSAKIGEKIELANVAHFTGDTHTYLHRRSSDLPPQVGVLVEFTGTNDEGLIHTVALQIASMSPKYVHQGEIDDEVIDNERRIAEATAREEGKPDHIIGRIVEGRINDFFKDVCLHDQAAISDDKATVGKLLDQAGVVITRFARFSAGA
ncbi:MAG: translation elongation factor Ts [Propionibacteriaceae bacterium]|jgi:elongation factor Ts|nr:translation elongation factor Ts [Propionibacteriaceae bacterium]